MPCNNMAGIIWCFFEKNAIFFPAVISPAPIKPAVLIPGKVGIMDN